MKEQKPLAEISLKELARKMHGFENEDNDIGFMLCADEVRRRNAEVQFRDIYMEVWRERHEKINCLHKVFHK